MIKKVRQIETKDASFIKRLKKCADAVGNFSKLSQISDISKSTLSGYKNGKNEPNRINLVKIAQASGADLNWLATGAGTAPEENGGEPPFPELIRRIDRCTANSSVEELSEDTGIPLARMERYIAGLEDLTASDAVKIATVAKVEVKWLVSGEGSVVAIPENNYIINYDIVKECSLALHQWLKDNKQHLEPEAAASTIALLCTVRQEQEKIDPVFIDRVMAARGKP